MPPAARTKRAWLCALSCIDRRYTSIQALEHSFEIQLKSERCRGAKHVTRIGRFTSLPSRASESFPAQIRFELDRVMSPNAEYLTDSPFCETHPKTSKKSTLLKARGTMAPFSSLHLRIGNPAQRLDDLLLFHSHKDRHDAQCNAI